MASEYVFESRAIPANADSDFVSDKLGSSMCQRRNCKGTGIDTETVGCTAGDEVVAAHANGSFFPYPIEKLKNNSINICNIYHNRRKLNNVIPPWRPTCLSLSRAGAASPPLPLPAAWVAVLSLHSVALPVKVSCTRRDLLWCNTRRPTSCPNLVRWFPGPQQILRLLLQ